MANAITNLRPESAKRMMSEISNRQTFAWIGIAAAFHLVLVVATSWHYIHDHWIDPAGAKERAAAVLVDTQAPVQPPATPVAAAAQPSATPAENTTLPPNDLEAKPNASSHAGAGDLKANTSADKPLPASSATPTKSGDTPKTPSHDGFNLDDSSLK